MQQHLMIDLETLGVGTNALILEIGLCFFDSEGIHSSHSIIIDVKNSQDLGFEVDLPTLNWWMSQSPDKFYRLIDPIEPKHTVEAAAQVVHNLTLEHEHNDAIIVWGNGADFDLVLLQNLFKKANKPYPFKYKNHRCFRTIKNILSAPAELEYRIDEMLAHTGKGDATNQASHLIKLNNHYPYGTRAFNIL
jgi:exodeoxyribonuclease VIII